MKVDDKLLGQYKRRKKTRKTERRYTTTKTDPKLILEDDVREVIRAFPGKYGPDGDEAAFVHYRGWAPGVQNPFNPKKMGWFLTCNCHAGNRKEDCVPCWEDGEFFKENGKHHYYSNAWYAINIIQYAKFHRVPTKKTLENGYSVGDDEYKAFFGRCKGEVCEWCEAEYETVSWRRCHLDLDEGGWEEFCQWSREITRKCRTCDTGEILPKSAACKKCGKDVKVDLNALLLMEVEEAKCPHCGTEGYMELEHDCQNRDHRTQEVTEGCGDPSYYDIWDCDLEISQTAKSKGKGKTLKLHNSYPGEIDDEKMMKSLDYPYRFKAYDLQATDDQASLLGIDNPFKAQAESTKKQDEGDD